MINVSPSIVRQATPEDEGELWVLLRQMHRENGLLPLSEPKVQYHLDRVLYPEKISLSDTGPRGVIGVIGPPSRLEGVIMLVLGHVWYSDAVMLQDCVNFVREDCRQSSHAKELIAYSKRMTDEIRKSEPDFKMMVGVVSTVRTQPKVRLYRRQLAEIGAFFMYPYEGEDYSERANSP